MPLPLHIFEQRYRDLLADVAGAPTGAASFGVVALRSGTEARTPARRRRPARTSRRSARWPRSSRSRPHETARPTCSRSAAAGSGSPRCRRRAEPTCGPRSSSSTSDDGDLSRRAGHPGPRADRGLRRDPDPAGRAGHRGRAARDANQLSYQIAARLPLPPNERQALLRDETTAARLERVAGYCGGRSRCCSGPAASPCPRRTADSHRRQLTARRTPAPAAGGTGRARRACTVVADRVGPAQVVADGEGDEQSVHQRDHRGLDEQQARACAATAAGACVISRAAAVGERGRACR